MIGVFGSTARGESNQESDIDLLVKFAEKKSLLGLVRLERELSEALGRKVDLLTHVTQYGRHPLKTAQNRCSRKRY